MKPETYSTLKLILGADGTVPDEHREVILCACRTDATGKRKTSERMINTRRAAEVLGVCIRTVHRYGGRGLLTPCKRTRRTIRWRLDEVEKLATVGSEAMTTEGGQE